MASAVTKLEAEFESAFAEIRGLFESCAQAQPRYNVPFGEFMAAVRMGADKYLTEEGTHAGNRLPAFLSRLHAADLYLALGCARGDEQAWWDFDRSYRGYMERNARYMAGSEVEADEVVEAVYVELYGTRVIDGVRKSKFATYTGLGSLKGWLRAIISHSVVDARRAHVPQIAIEDVNRAGDEVAEIHAGHAHAGAGENEIIERITRDRYVTHAAAALEQAFAALRDYEKLLLCYYYVDGLNLREIAGLVGNTGSALGLWFHREMKRPARGRGGRLHESTVMRWLDKIHTKVSDYFRATLAQDGITGEAADLCVRLAAEDLAGVNLRDHLTRAGAVAPRH